jgi:hypothetical protein
MPREREAPFRERGTVAARQQGDFLSAESLSLWGSPAEKISLPLTRLSPFRERGLPRHTLYKPKPRSVSG